MDKKALKKTPPIILASSSPRRLKILSENNIEFTVIAPAVNELQLESAKDTVLHNAKIKAKAVFEDHNDSLIIAADTVISLNDQILGKPKNLEEAADMLLRLSGKSHDVLTGVSIISKNCQKDYCERTRVEFKNLTKNDIDAYHSKCSPLDKAGAYNIDEQGDLIIKTISGSYSNVMGLPIESLLKSINFNDF